MQRPEQMHEFPPRHRASLDFRNQFDTGHIHPQFLANLPERRLFVIVAGVYLGVADWVATKLVNFIL